MTFSYAQILAWKCQSYGGKSNLIKIMVLNLGTRSDSAYLNERLEQEVGFPKTWTCPNSDAELDEAAPLVAA